MRSVIIVILSIAIIQVMFFAMNASYTIDIYNNPAPKVIEHGARNVTAYTVGRVEETDSTPCIGAYGDNLCVLIKKGYTICASNEFPKGTVLTVGPLKCTVMDRMNRRYRNQVDVAMDNYQEAVNFGRKVLPVSSYGTRQKLP